MPAKIEVKCVFMGPGSKVPMKAFQQHEVTSVSVMMVYYSTLYLYGNYLQITYCKKSGIVTAPVVYALVFSCCSIVGA
jgi:hypothetical protein